MRPLIGITLSFDKGVHQLRHAYVQAIDNASATPVLLPAVESDDALRAMVAPLQGLVIPGGPAVTIGLDGELPSDIGVTDPIRARFDVKVVKAFLASSRPVLGICYGMQLLNALDGGTIHADVERDVAGALPHSPKRGGESHPIDIEAGSHLSRILGKRTAIVNTRHIQAVATVGPSYRVSAVAPDGVVEAIETPDGRVLGVQFHPERMDMPAIFEHFVARCASVDGTA